MIFSRITLSPQAEFQTRFATGVVPLTNRKDHPSRLAQLTGMFRGDGFNHLIDIVTLWIHVSNRDITPWRTLAAHPRLSFGQNLQSVQ